MHTAYTLPIMKSIAFLRILSKEIFKYIVCPESILGCNSYLLDIRFADKEHNLLPEKQYIKYD